MSKRNAKYRELWERAREAGEAAHANAAPTPMNVVFHGQVWHVPDGVCGFAGVVVPGNSGIGRWLRKNGIGHKHWPSGWYVSTNYQMSQSMERAEAAARAVAEVLNEAGEKAYPYSRID
jgi:hypothetical protein